MLSSLLAILFLIKLKLHSTTDVATYIRRKYNDESLRVYRRLQSTCIKQRKAELDLEFLQYCRMNEITPNFVKFKLYRKHLYSSEFYRSSTLKLLDMEIKYKETSVSKLEITKKASYAELKATASYLDFIYFQCLINKYLNHYSAKTKVTHDRKLSNLGINKPQFNSSEKVIFNYSDLTLSAKQKFLLSLGLNFGLPCYKPKFENFFLPFEKLFRLVKDLPSIETTRSARNIIQDISHRFFVKLKKSSSWLPFFNKHDLGILKSLALNKNIVICRPDKGNGVVLLNRSDYNEKMHNILNDDTKFKKIGNPEYKQIFFQEDKINRKLRAWKTEGIITDTEYKELYSSGSSFGILYGLPKTHKPDTPLRPILAAYNSASFHIAKFLVPLLKPLTVNEFSLRNSYEFADEIRTQNASNFLVSYDVTSLFTNVPLAETIDIILGKLFPTDTTFFHGFDKVNFRHLLTLAVMDNYFIFDNVLYMQIDGMAMGSPLGPTFANIFMCYLEEKMFRNPVEFQPTYYKRYVDDTFVMFRSPDDRGRFLEFINSLHSNIKFTMETEREGKLAFLDVYVMRKDGNLITDVFRKSTFSGLGLNFHSFTDRKFMMNSCRTLIFRAFKICSNWHLFHKEINFLGKFFSSNSYPSHIFPKMVNKFLCNFYEPPLQITTVPKKIIYLSLPYIGIHTKTLKNELISCMTRLYPMADFRFCFTNPRTLQSLFKFKDTLPELMQSGVVYKYFCPKCSLGTYVGNTNRLLKVRIDSHRGTSHRTGCNLNVKETSAIRDHSRKCKVDITGADFKILARTNCSSDLLILESLFIKTHFPNLNNDTSSTPLYIA